MQQQVKNQDIEEILKKFNARSTTVSTLVRSLAFAGIGVVWIMSNERIDELNDYMRPLLLFAGGLVVDVIQYLWQSVTLIILYYRKLSALRRKEILPKDEVPTPHYIAVGAWVCFVIKVVLVLAGFLCVCRNLWTF